MSSKPDKKLAKPRVSRVSDMPVPYRTDGPGEPRFLSLGDILALHQDLISRYGGDPGVLDLAALETAVAQPRMTAFGVLIHATLIDQAAAYLFHLVVGRPFCDGNKRIGLCAAMVFLQDNQAQVLGSPDEWYELTVAVVKGTVAKGTTAKGAMTKRQVAERMALLVRLV